MLSKAQHPCFLATRKDFFYVVAKNPGVWESMRGSHVENFEQGGSCLIRLTFKAFTYVIALADKLQVQNL